MENNPYIERCRRESYILEFNRNRTHLNPSVIEGNPDNLKSHLLQIKGNDQGVYFDSRHKEVPSGLSRLKEQEQALEKEWKQHVESRINQGEKPPKKWPLDLQDKKDRLEARKMVAEEEVKWLEEQLVKAEEEKHKREKKPANSRLSGAGRLSNGVLVEFCDWPVSKNSEGILAINDPSSPFNTMEIWRLKSEVLNPLDAEHRLRQREEVKAALAENRKRNHVAYPSVPVYIKEKDQIQYPGNYHNETIKKLKQSEE